MAFNSPVWFNVGVEERPQCRACFINSVQDSMSSIMDLAKTEAMLFKYGSGAGVNLSPIRGSKEKMSGGGIASGPVSFMKGFDAFAGVVKSGGKTRRAAKMVILDADHPDVMEFIDSKASEEKKAWALIEAGYDASFTGEAYGSIFFQNANHSVRVTDDFMHAVQQDGDWTTREVTTGEAVDTMPARTVFRKMAEAAWLCGDPGIQYDTTINDWHTSAVTRPHLRLQPLLGYMFLNDRRPGNSASRRRIPRPMADYCACVEAVFGVDPSTQVTATVHPTDKGPHGASRTCRAKGALQFLEFCGLPADGRPQRRCRSSSGARHARSCSRSWVHTPSGDGHVGKRSIEFASASDWLLEEVQLLALNMGVVGRRSTIQGCGRLAFLG